MSGLTAVADEGHYSHEEGQQRYDIREGEQSYEVSQLQCLHPSGLFLITWETLGLCEVGSGGWVGVDGVGGWLGGGVSMSVVSGNPINFCCFGEGVCSFCVALALPTQF